MADVFPQTPSTPFGLKYRLRRELRPYERAEVLALPRGHTGVYAIWLPSAEIPGANDCIYIGKSESCIRRRLLDHLRPREPNPKLRALLQTFGNIALFSLAYTASRAETDALETAVIRDWGPEGNRNKILP